MNWLNCSIRGISVTSPSICCKYALCSKYGKTSHVTWKIPLLVKHCSLTVVISTTGCFVKDVLLYGGTAASNEIRAGKTWLWTSTSFRGQTVIWVGHDGNWTRCHSLCLACSCLQHNNLCHKSHKGCAQKTTLYVNISIGYLPAFIIFSSILDIRHISIEGINEYEKI
jgi:hypothetical protein